MSVSLLVFYLYFFEKEAFEKTSTFFKVIAFIAVIFESILNFIKILN